MNISLKLDKKGLNKVDKCPLFVRMRSTASNGRRIESSLNTGIKILPKYFVKGVLSVKTPNYTNKQRVLNSILDDLDRIVSELKEQGLLPNPSLVKKLYQDGLSHKEEITPKIKSFWQCFEEYLSTKAHTTNGYKKSLNTLRNRLQDFELHRGRKLTFDFIIGQPITFQNELQTFFWENKNLSNGYVNKQLSRLSNFLYFCVQQGYIQRKPSFRHNEIIERDEKIYLYKNEVFKLYKSLKWDYEKGKDFTNNPHIYVIEQTLEGERSSEFGGFLRITNWELVKDIFLFLCSIGCRYSDIHQFKVRHFSFEKEDSVFTWIQQKTNQPVSVPVNEISGEIFRKYSRGKALTQVLFPKLSVQKFNKTLKFLFKDLQFNRLVTFPKKIGSKVVNTEERFLWELISSHSGRRTFIKNLIDIGTMDYQTIMKLSGHKSLSEFQKYISVSKKDLAKGKELFRSEMLVEENGETELIGMFSKLSLENKKIVLQLTRNLL